MSHVNFLNEKKTEKKRGRPIGPNVALFNAPVTLSIQKKSCMFKFMSHVTCTPQNVAMSILGTGY